MGVANHYVRKTGLKWTVNVRTDFTFTGEKYQ